MPWKAVSLMSLRYEFVTMVKDSEMSFSEMCHRFNISRKTGYKWLHRYLKEGSAGLVDKSRKPHQIAFKLEKPTEDRIVTLRKKHPCWGARKLRKKLQEAGNIAVPACSTITTVLHRHGFIHPEDSTNSKEWQRFEHPAPNSLWQMDFKSPVSTLAGPCQPLTILDDYSRFNLCLEALPNQKTDQVQQTLETTFSRYGLPDRMLMDNGSPWGLDREHPYTHLTVWLIRVGVSISHSRPYHPQTLGKDERFHRTLKKELLNRFQWRDPSHLQQALDPWRHEYNFERPHDSLGLAVPASRYQPSLRRFPDKLPPIEYPSGVEVRKVQSKGEFFFKGRVFNVSNAFHGYPIGVRPTLTDGVFDVLFCHETISHIDMKTNL